MSLCSICPKPGACCSGFFLYSGGDAITVWKEWWQVEAQAAVDRLGLPFVAHAIHTEYENGAGEYYVIPTFKCDKLLDSGLCGIYETRPNVCRTFTPGTDELCVMTKII